MGQHSGGEGVIRDIEFRIPVQVSILSERRVYHPYGLEGGEDAECGLNIWVRKIGRGDRNADSVTGMNGRQQADGVELDRDREGSEVELRYINLGAKNTASMRPGERIIVMTPGGGGWGKVGEESKVVTQVNPKLAWRLGSVGERQAVAEASA